MESSSDVPAHVRRFLATRVDTFEKLEVVVALHAAPQVTMSFEELTTRLGIPGDFTREVVTLLRSGLLVEVTPRGHVRLAPKSDSDRAVLQEVVDIYADDRLAIVKALGEIAMHRLRSMASRAFADAFVFTKKLKKDDSDDG